MFIWNSRGHGWDLFLLGNKMRNLFSLSLGDDESDKDQTNKICNLDTYAIHAISRNLEV